MKKLLTMLLALLLGGVTAPAMAATYLFSMSGDATASFTLSGAPCSTCNDRVRGVDRFWYNGVSVTYNGQVINNVQVTFLSKDHGGLSFTQGSTPTQAGTTFFDAQNAFDAQLYTGTRSSPNFIVDGPGDADGPHFLGNGTFNTTTGTFPNNYTLSIQEVTSGVPEPGTWMMMIVGFGVVGYGMRRKKAQALNTFAVAA